MFDSEYCPGCPLQMLRPRSAHREKVVLKRKGVQEENDLEGQ